MKRYAWFASRSSSFIIDRPVSRWIGLWGLHIVILFLATVAPYPHASIVYLSHNEYHARHAFFWFQYDVLFYQHIAHHGYHLGQAVFFPFVPALIYLFGRWGSLIIVQVAYLGILVGLDKWFAQLSFSESERLRGLVLFAVNPASIFYGTLYTEPWTMLWAVWSFYAATRSRYGWAAAFAFLGALTHGTGILIGIMPLVALVRAMWLKQKTKMVGALWWGMGTVMGIGVFGAILVHAGLVPWAFVTGQNAWHAQWIWPWQQFLKVPPNAIVYGFAVVAASQVIALGRAMTLTSSSEASLTWSYKIYVLIGGLVSLSFFVHYSFHSTLRLLSDYFPLYAGAARLTWRPAFWFMFLVLWAFSAVGGALWYSHGFWYQ